MENEISVLIGLAVVAGVFYFYKKNDKKPVSKTTYSKPVSEKNQPKRGPGSTPKKTSQKKAPAKAKKPAVAKKTVAKKAAPKKAKKSPTTGKTPGPKKGSAKPKLQVK